MEQKAATERKTKAGGMGMNVTIRIRRRYAEAVLFECDAPDVLDSGLHMRHALEKATGARANLSGANLRGANLRGADLDSALNDFAWELEAQDDAHASATFRRHLVRQLGAQVIAQVTETSR